MTDTRVCTVTRRAVNLVQLDAELGHHGLSADATTSDDGVETRIVAVEGSPVTLDVLEHAVAVHEPVWPPTRAEQAAAAIDAAKGLGDLKVVLKDLFAEVLGS